MSGLDAVRAQFAGGGSFLGDVGISPRFDSFIYSEGNGAHFVRRLDYMLREHLTNRIDVNTELEISTSDTKRHLKEI